jgi:hypothetical protein
VSSASPPSRLNVNWRATSRLNFSFIDGVWLSGNFSKIQTTSNLFVFVKSCTGRWRREGIWRDKKGGIFVCDSSFQVRKRWEKSPSILLHLILCVCETNTDTWHHRTVLTPLYLHLWGGLDCRARGHF